MNCESCGRQMKHGDYFGTGLCNKCHYKHNIKNTGNKIDDDTIEAATGYYGIVDKPTAFLVGEAGPEMVNIKPIGKSSKQKKSMRNDDVYTFDFDYDFQKDFKGLF